MRRTLVGGGCVHGALIAAAIAAMAGRAYADSGSVSLTFQWTDRGGNVHPMGYVYNTGFYNTALTSNNSGGPANYAPPAGTASYSGTSLFGSLDFYGQISANFGVGNLSYFQIFDTGGTEYTQRWPTSGFVNASGGGTTAYTHTVDNTTYNGAAFGMGATFMFGANYADSLGASAPYLRIYYDSTTVGSFYQRNAPNTPYLQIDREDWASQDVMLHEYGHHVAAYNNINASPGGPHSFEGDNISGAGRPAGTNNMPPAGTGLGPDQGSKLAWGEGFATYFGLSAVRSGNLAAAIPGLPSGDYDDWYDDLNAPGSTASFPAQSYFSVNAERPLYFTGGPAGTVQTLDRRGEGSELSVLLAMWDYYDSTNEAHNHSAYHAKTRQWCSDRVSYGDRDAWNRLIIAGGGSKTFKQYWFNLAADMGTATGRGKVSGLATNQKDEAVAACGESLEAAGIADVPLSPDANQMLNTRRPEFSWAEQNYSNSEMYRVLVFSNDWSTLVYGSPVLFDPDMNSIQNIAYTPTVDLPLGTFWWVITNSPAGATEASVTGNANRYNLYWSGARQFTLIPEPGVGFLALGGLILIRRRRRMV